MKNKVLSIVMASTLLLTSCASIVSKSNYPISINSSPSEANISVTDKRGKEVYKGTTPANLKLKSGAGYFGKASYQVKFEKEGYETKIVPIHFKFDGWYIGNIVFGGLIGLLIVDPLTGAMYKLDTEFVNETLVKSSAVGQNEELKIYTLDEIPNNWKEHLVLINE
jgi:hypothetical protein